MGRLRRLKPRRLPELRLTQYEAFVMDKIINGNGPRLTPEEWEVAKLVGERSIDVTIRSKIMKGELRADDWNISVEGDR